MINNMLEQDVQLEYDNIFDLIKLKNMPKIE